MSEPIGTALVITVSTRAHAGVYADQSGPIIAAALTDTGFIVDGPQIVPDGKAVGWALRDGIAHGYDVIITTGRHRAVAERRHPGADQNPAGEGDPAPGRGHHRARGGGRGADRGAQPRTGRSGRDVLDRQPAGVRAVGPRTGWTC